MRLVPLVLLAPRGHRVLREQSAPQGRKVQRGPLAHKARSAQPEQRGRLAQQGPLGLRVAQVLQGLRAPRVSKEIRARLGLAAQRVQPQPYLAPQGQQVLLGRLEQRALQAPQGPQEPLERSVLLALPGLVAQAALVAHRALQGQLVRQVTLEQQGHREQLAQLAQVARLGRQAPRGLLALLALPGRLAQCNTPHTRPASQPPQTLARYG